MDKPNENAKGNDADANANVAEFDEGFSVPARTSAAFSKGTTVNEAQRHLMKIAATNPFLLVQLSQIGRAHV